MGLRSRAMLDDPGSTRSPSRTRLRLSWMSPSPSSHLTFRHARQADSPSRTALRCSSNEKTERGRASYLRLKGPGISTRYFRVSRLLDELTLARRDGSCPKLVQRLAKTWLLVLDDLGPQGRFHEAAVRLNQADPHHPQPHPIHPYPALFPDHRSTPDGLVRNGWTAWPGTGRRLRSGLFRRHTHIWHRRRSLWEILWVFPMRIEGFFPFSDHPLDAMDPIHAVGGIVHQPVSRSAGVHNTEALHGHPSRRTLRALISR